MTEKKVDMPIEHRLTVLLPFLLAVILIVCIFPLPYGYYTFVRFAVCLATIYLANDSIKKDHLATMVFFIAVALLFNPLFQVTFARKVWNVIDVALGILFLLQGIRNVLAEQRNK
jgi:hypothetical protein